MSKSTFPKQWAKMVSKPIESGQAWVWRVRNEDHAGDHALKRWKKIDRVDRLRREFDAMQDLFAKGAPVPKIVDKDLDDAKNPWYVMPWYEQGSLESIGHVSRDKFSTLDRLLLVDQVALALSRIHEFGYAHRDVKPANILRSGDDVVIADFGLCISNDDTRLTAEYEAIGPWLYIAPENQSGRNDGLQFPADFYAWGKLAWSLIAGRTPPAREYLLQDKHRLEIQVKDERLSDMHKLLRQLLEEIPERRLANWSEVRRDLAHTIGKYQEVDQVRTGDSAGIRTVIAAVRRISVNLDSANKATEENARRKRFNEAKVLEEYMAEEMHRLLDAEFGEFNEAADGAVLLTISGGLHTLSEVLRFTDYQSTELADILSLSENSRALFLLQWNSPEGLDTNLQVLLFTLVESGSVRFLRIPLLAKVGAPLRRFHGVANASEIGEPLTIGLASTEVAARNFARNSAQFARDCILRWTRLMEDGKDPYLTQIWD
ncbi:protein kinase [Glycomyces sp. NPDC047010]|uniref:protein kinase domain-containing protein n=1 Tax=Glycomyces sp. NPDC047010 TaxID=3155023 RepID=UPI0033FB6DFA